MLKALKQLCGIPAPSGREEKIRDYILSELQSFCECTVQSNGNIICFKKGKNTTSKKIMIDAHIDEVGIIVTHITADGYIKFSSVGGISPSVMSGRRVFFENGTVGVVGIKPVHLAKSEEKKKYTAEDDLYIDIGADTKEDTEKVVRLGDTAVFEGGFCAIGKNLIARAIDDRAGVAVLMRLLKEDSEYDFYATFTVQEEVGCRGAKTAAFELAPDGAVVLEATTAADLEGVADEKTVCRLGGGVAVSFMDRATLYDKRLYDTALSSGLKCQPKSAVAGGNNSGAIHLSRGGVPTLALSVPCRYIHSSSCLSNLEDLEDMYRMAKYMLSKMASGEVL